MSDTSLRTSKEADKKQLELAKKQGDTYAQALEHMLNEEAQTGDKKIADDYIIGFACEEAEGMYEWEGDELVWRNPDKKISMWKLPWQTPPTADFCQG